MRIAVKRIRPGPAQLPLPSYQTPGAAGMDLMADTTKPVRLRPGERAVISTGLAVELPEGFEAQVRPRSGLAAQHGVTVLNSPGTIDPDYRGEIQVVLVNLGSADFVVRRGERIAQMVIAPIVRATWGETDGLALTSRADRGFGHTDT